MTFFSRFRQLFFQLYRNPMAPWDSIQGPERLHLVLTFWKFLRRFRWAHSKYWP